MVVGGTCTVLVVPGVWWWEGLALYLWCQVCGEVVAVGGACTVFVV